MPTASYLRRRSAGQQIKRIRQALAEGRTIRLREYHPKVEVFREEPLVDFSYVDEVERLIAGGLRIVEAREAAAKLCRRQGYERERVSQGEPYKSHLQRQQEREAKENSLSPRTLVDRIRKLNQRIKKH